MLSNLSVSDQTKLKVSSYGSMKSCAHYHRITSENLKKKYTESSSQDSVEKPNFGVSNVLVNKQQEQINKQQHQIPSFHPNVCHGFMHPYAPTYPPASLYPPPAHHPTQIMTSLSQAPTYPHTISLFLHQHVQSLTTYPRHTTTSSASRDQVMNSSLNFKFMR